jgi:hypothetical protein
MHQHSMITQPDHAAVLGDAPILHAPWVTGELDPPVLGCCATASLVMGAALPGVMRSG